MIQLEEISEARSTAKVKWREYRTALRENKNQDYKDLTKAYNQLKGGRKLVDIFKAIQKGGIDENTYHPKLAIAQAKCTKVLCKYRQQGSVDYINTYKTKLWRWNVRKEDISLSNCLPAIPKEKFVNQWQSDFQLEAPVPIIPAKVMPKILTDDYYVLWEVDEWKLIPPTDPYLLKRITKTLFVVLAGWNLTPLEKSVMHGRMI